MREDKIIVNNIEVNYKIAGEGPAILVLHGWGGSSDSWVRVQDILSRKGYTILVLDFPGFGRTPPPYDPWAVGDYMEFLNSFIREVKKKEKSFVSPFFLLGHSFGGRVSIKFCIKYPEYVRKLILMDSAGIKPGYGFKGSLIFVAALLGNALFTPKVLRRFKDSVRSIFYRVIRNRDYAKANGIMKETLKKVLKEDLLPEIPGLNKQTLIVWGGRDRIVPVKDAYTFKNIIKGSKLEIFKEVGHSPHLECPETLSGVIKNFFV